MVIKIGFIGILLALLFQKIKNTIQLYIDKINLLENKLVRINENYKSLADNFNQHTHLEDLMWVEINKSHDVLENKINETYDKLKSETNNSYDELKCDVKKHKQIITGLENELFQMNEKIDKMNENICYEDAINEISDTCDKLTSIFNVYKEETNNSYDELKCDVKKHKQIITGLENELFQMNETLAETTCAISEINKTCTHLIEDIDIENKNIKSEISNLNSFVTNNDVFIGYKPIHKSANNAIPLPLFASSNIDIDSFYKIMAFGIELIVVNQLKFLKKITKIKLNHLINKVIIFNNIWFKKLHNEGFTQSKTIIKKNNPHYFVVYGDFIMHNGICSWSPVATLEQKVYIKNGITKMFKLLKNINIELVIPDSLDIDFK
jgi:predicted  nucleic acid-binding Zn-ribbon protein